MRKGFIYSLAALAAMPVAGNAAVGTEITNAVNNSNWAGTVAKPTISNEDVTWSQGEISLNVGKRIAGSYTFNFKLTNPAGQVTVKIGDVEKLVPVSATQQDVVVEFTLSKETDVNVTITPAVEGTNYMVSSAKLSFDHSNFTDPIATLEKAAATVSYAIKNTYKYATVATEQVALGEQVKKIDAIKAALTYESYVTNNLADVNNCQIIKDIQTIGATAAKQNASYLNDVANTYLNQQINLQDATNSTYATLPAEIKKVVDASLKATLTDEYTALTKLIKDFRTAVNDNYANQTSVAFRDAKATDINGATYKLTNIKNEISKISSQLGDQVNFYGQIMTAVNDSKSNYNKYQNEIVKVLGGDVYSDWLTKAQSALDKLAQQIHKVETNAKANYDANVLTADSVTNYNKTLSDLDFAAIETNYIDPATALQKEYGVNTTAISTMRENLGSFEPNEYLVKDNNAKTGRYPVYTKNFTAINTSVDDLETLVESNNKAHTSIANFKADHADAIFTKITNLKNFVIAENAFYKLLSATYTDANAKVSACAYDSTYKYSDGSSWTIKYNAAKVTKWGKTEKSITDKIASCKKLADAILGTNPTYDYESDTLAIAKSIGTYQSNAESAFATFKDLVAKSGKYNEIIKTITNKLNGLSVKDATAADYGATGDSYADQLKNFNAELVEYNKKITAAVAKTMVEAAHKEALEEIQIQPITDLETYLDAATLKTYLDNISENQAKFDKTLQTKQRATLIDIINAKIKGTSEVPATPTTPVIPAVKGIDALLTTLNDVNEKTANATYGEAFVADLQKAYKAESETVSSLKTDFVTYQNESAASDGSYTTVIAELTTLSQKFDAVKTLIDASIAHQDSCKANKTAYDNDYTAMVAKLADYLTTAKSTVSTSYSDVKDLESIASKWDPIDKDREQLDKDTQASYDGFSLVSDWTKSLKGRYDALKKRIDDNVALAKTEQTNFTDSKAALADITTEIGNVETAITTAMAASEKNGGPAGIDYYENTLLNVTYRNQLNAIKKSATDENAKRNCQNVKKDILESLATLKKTIDGVPALSLVNFTNYKYVVAEGQDSVVKAWNDASYYISSTDESSQKEKYQKGLKEINDNLIATFKTSIESMFENGKFAPEEKLKNANVQVQLNQKSYIIGEINTLLNKQKNAYSSVVAGDNAKRLSMFNDAFANAQKAFVSYVEKINTYKNDLKQTDVQDAVKKVYENSPSLNEALFSAKYTDQLNDLYKRAHDTYDHLTGTQLFDADSKFLEEAKNDSDDLRVLFDQFQGAILTEAQNLWNNGVHYQSLRDAAYKEIKDYATESAIKNAFKDVDDLISKATGAIKSLTDFNLVVFDDAFYTLGNETNFNSMLSNDKDAAAVKDITALLKTADDQVVSDLAYLNSSDLKISDDLRTSTIDNYNKVVTETLGEAKKLTSGFAKHNDIVTYINAYYSGAGRTDVTTLKNNVVIKAEVDKLFTGMEKQLAAVTETVSKYYVAEDFQDDLLSWSDRIADKKSMLNTYYLLNGTIDEEVVTKLKTALTTALNKVLVDAKTEELAQLKKDVNTLNAEYIKYTQTLSDPTTADKDIKKKIDDITTDLGKVINLDDAKIVSTLCGLEDRMAVIRTDLAKLYSAVSNATIYASLNKQIKDLSDKVATVTESNYSKYAVDKVVNDKAVVLGLINVAQTFVDGVKDSLAYYQDKAQKRINNISDYLTDLMDNVKAFQEIKNTSDKNADALQAEIDNILAARTEFIQLINNGTTHTAPTTGKDFYSINDVLDNIVETANLSQGKIKTLKDNVNALETEQDYKDLKLQVDLDFASDGLYARNLEDYINDVAVIELKYRAKNLKSKLVQVLAVLTNQSDIYSPAVLSDLTKAYNAINTPLAAFTDSLNNSSYYASYFKDSKLVTNEAKISAWASSLNELVTNMTEQKKGDINQNGSIGAQDYTMLMKAVLNPDDVKSEDLDIYDINGDSYITVADAVAIADIIMTPTNVVLPSTSQANAYMNNIAERLSLQTISQSNNVTRVAVNLNNAKAYVAYQMDVKLPSNMKLVGQSLTSRADVHELFAGEVNGSTRIVAASIDNNTFKGNEGAVLYLDIETVGNFDASQIEFSNIIFATRDAQQTVMSLGSQTTGINSVEGNAESLKNKIYNVGGKLMNQIKKGINIIRNSDGSTQKVIKK